MPEGRPRFSKAKTEVIPVLERIGPRVANRRRELGLSTRELATRAGVSTEVLWRVEHAKGDIYLSSLVVIANVLDVLLEDLVGP